MSPIIHIFQGAIPHLLNREAKEETARDCFRSLRNIFSDRKS